MKRLKLKNKIMKKKKNVRTRQNIRPYQEAGPKNCTSVKLFNTKTTIQKNRQHQKIFDQFRYTALNIADKRSTDDTIFVVISHAG